MAKLCDINKQAANDFALNEEIKVERGRAIRDKIKDGYLISEKFDEEAKKLYLEGDVLPDVAVDKVLENMYGTKGERDIVVHKIMGIMENYPLIDDLGMFDDFIQTHIGPGVKIVDPNGQFDFRKLSVSKLKNIYREMISTAKAFSGENKAHAVFGNFLGQLYTPKHLSKKSKSFREIATSVRDYAAGISYDINNFMDSKRIKSLNPKMKMGMEEVLKKIESLAMHHKVGDNVQARNVKMVSIFSMYMGGRVWWNNDTDQFMINQTRVMKRDKDGNLERWPDNSVKYTYADAISLEDYVPTGGKKGDIWIPMDEKRNGKLIHTKMLSEFKELAEEARKIDTMVFNWMKKHMESSLNTLFKSLKKPFKNLNDEQLRTLFFKPESLKALEIAKHLSAVQKDMYQTLQKTFATNITDDFVITTGGSIQLDSAEFKNKHWPNLYNVDVFKPMLDSLHQKFLSEKAIAKAQWEASVNPGERKELKQVFDEKKGQLANIEKILNNLDGYHVDLTQNTILPFAKDNKYFKRISNAYDLRSARTDSGVYYDYLKNVMGSVHRNLLSAKLVDALGMAETPAIKRAVVNYYKVPFHATDLEGPFGITVESVTRKINTLSGIINVTYTPEQVNTTLKTWTSAATGLYLSNVSSAFTNLSAVTQNFIDWGIKDSFEAWGLMEDSNYKANIEELVAMSGITEFSDFFSKSMINGIVGKQVEENVAEAMIDEMLKYHVRIDAGDGYEVARKDFEDAILILLEQSDLAYDPSEVIILDKKRAKARRKDNRRRHRLTLMNKLVQFSITKTYVYADPIKKNRTKLKKMFYDAKSGLWKVTAKTFIEPYAKAMKGKTFLTMNETEAFLRTLSFTTGVERHWKAGQFQNGRVNGMHWTQFTTEQTRLSNILSKLQEKDNKTAKDMENIKVLETKIQSLFSDISQILVIGKEFSYFTNFGLSSQDVGQFNWNGIGNLAGKFKYWSQQKFGRDVRIFREAYTGFKRLSSIEDNKFDVSAVGKLLKSLATNPLPAVWKNDRLRIANSEAAALREFILMQGLITFAWDLFMSGPKLPTSLRGPQITQKMLRGFLYYLGMGKTVRNWTSDLVSLSLSPLTILIKGLFWNAYGDEEDWEHQLTYVARRTFLGLLPMLAFDQIMGMLYLVAENEKKASEKIINGLSPILGGSTPPGKLIQKKAKEGLEEILR